MTLAEIRQFILDKITSTGTGFINGANLRTALTEMVDKITSQTFLTGWLIPGTVNTIVANNDDAYRLGKTIIGRTTDNGSGAIFQVEGRASIGGVTTINGNLGLQGVDVSNFNDYTDIGSYCFGSDSAVWMANGNGPGLAYTGVSHFGTLRVSRSALGNTIHEYIDNAEHRVYMRQKWGPNAWGQWVCHQRPLRLTPAGSLPSIAPNTAGLGTGGTATMLNGTDMAGTLRIRTGSNPNANNFLCSVTFSSAYPVAPRVVILTPANQAAAREYAKVVMSGMTTAGFVLYGSNLTPLTAGYDFDFFYMVIQ